MSSHDYRDLTHAATAGLANVSAHDLRHAAACLWRSMLGKPLHRLRDRLRTFERARDLGVSAHMSARSAGHVLDAFPRNAAGHGVRELSES